MNSNKTAPTLPNGANFFTSENSNIHTTTNNAPSPTIPNSSAFLQSIETEEQTLLETINTQPNILGIIHSIGSSLILLIGIIITIVLLIKSIQNRKKIMEEISLETINHVQKKSLILLILSIISCSIPVIVIAIISTLLIYNAKKVFNLTFEASKVKLNISTILNIISIVLLTLTFTLLIFALFTSGMQLLRMTTMIY